MTPVRIPGKKLVDAAEVLREAFLAEREQAMGIPHLSPPNDEIQKAFRAVGGCPDRDFPQILEIIFGDKPEPANKGG